MNNEQPTCREAGIVWITHRAVSEPCARIIDGTGRVVALVPCDGLTDDEHAAVVRAIIEAIK